MLVIDDIAATDPIRQVASGYISAYEKQFGNRPATFGANTFDAGLLLQRAIPIALTAAEPGTEAFRVRTARCAGAAARRRRLSGCIQHESDQPQRHGRAGARTRRRQGRQVQAPGAVSAVAGRVRF